MEHELLMFNRPSPRLLFQSFLTKCTGGSDFTQNTHFSQAIINVVRGKKKKKQAVNDNEPFLMEDSSHIGQKVFKHHP